MITINHRGSFKNTENFLKEMSKSDIFVPLSRLAQSGVDALAANTPVESGLAAASWGYIIDSEGGGYSITWTNTNVENGYPVAIMLQYGHATGTGGYVQGRDYINPAMKPIFDRIEQELWKAVTSA